MLDMPVNAEHVLYRNCEESLHLSLLRFPEKCQRQIAKSNEERMLWKDFNTQ